MPKKLLAAMAAAGLCATIASPALAQNATATTPGGDVTADEATPLPPIVVQSPSEPIRRKGRRSTASTPSAAPGVVIDDSEGFESDGVDSTGSVGVFTLGQHDMIGGGTITNDAMRTFNKQSLDQAVNIMPGVTMHNTGGSRNERDIYVRGFDRFRVPVSIDGVRIYLPYDNRLDLGRFLTPDLAEIQVQKGYVSVLNGPGGMGGAINMVSRKPTKAVELEGRVGLVTNGDLDDMNRWSSYAYAGTRQKGWYAQVSGTIVDQDHFSLSKDFRSSPFSGPYPAQGPAPVTPFPYEDGGNRENSDFKDWRVNAKVGITPNATDEYSINYTTQSSEKSAPLHVDRQIVFGRMQNRPRFWEWPQWDLSSLSWLSKTQIGSASYVKTNAFFNTFDNILSFYPDSTFTNQYTDSPYAEESYGGFVEFGTQLIPMNTLKGSIHFRHDEHQDGDINYTYHPVTGNLTGVTRQPIRTYAEETWSFAVENTFHATRDLDFVAGVSYDRNEVLKSGTSTIMPEVDAWNWQTAAIYRYSREGSVHANVSSRTRFPTLFDRYSTRFDSRPPNPNIGSERATNYEIGVSDTLFSSLSISSSVFYSDIEDSIQNVMFGHTGNSTMLGLNVDGEHYGFEISADWTVSPTLRIGGNYTYIERDYDFASAALGIQAANATQTANQRAAASVMEVEGVPRHQAFIYLAWKAMDKLTLTPSLELASNRISMVTSCRTTLLDPATADNCPTRTTPIPLPNFVDIGAHALVNFQAEYEFNDNASMQLGVTNLFDKNYFLAEGFPEPGRQFYANARVKF